MLNSEWQQQLIAFVSKRLSDAAEMYSIAELDLCGLVINIVSVAHLLTKVFSHIIKRKAKPATTRRKRLLEVIN